MSEPEKPSPRPAAPRAPVTPDAPETPTFAPVDLDHRVHGLRDGLPGMRDLMQRLLGPDGCPWDKEQDLDSLRPYLIEEAYEVLEAMDDPRAHRKELGDLLFQIVFQSALREREGHFDLDDVIASIRTKMLRRHPHVFGPTDQGPRPSAEEVTRQWAALKLQERREEARKAGQSDDTSQNPGQNQDTSPALPNPLAGVPRALPALQRAWRLQEKAAAVGFDWPDLEGPRAKVDEEWAELREAIEGGDKAAIEEELGDLLFVLVRLGQKLDVEAEGALRGTISKFERRFEHVVRRCHEEGIELDRAGLETLDGFWREAKAQKAT